MSGRTLLAHIAPMTTIQLENLATNALYLLLAQYPSAAGGFIALVRELAPGLPETMAFETQARAEYGGIPDMVGTNSGREVLLVEAKFWASFTRNQPVAYINRLPHDEGALLLVLGPAERAARLWTDVERLCREAEIEFTPAGGGSVSPRIAMVGDGRRVALVTWDGLLARLESALEGKGHSKGAADVDQLRGLCERIDDEELRPISLHGALAAGDHWEDDLNTIVDGVIDALASGGQAQTRGYKATPGPGYYKRYMTFRGQMNWCVEWNHCYLNRFGHTSLWLTAQDSEEVRARAKQLLPGPQYFADGRLLIPLFAPDGLSRSEVVAHFVRRAEEVGLHLEGPV